MYKYPFTFFLMIIFFMSKGQTKLKDFHIGLNAEMMLEAPSYDGFLGVLGKYDFSKKHNTQVSLGVQSPNYAVIGGEYIYNFLYISDNFYLSSGAGLSLGLSKSRDTWSNSSISIGPNINISQRISTYAQYKIKYYFSDESIAPNWISIGVRYKL